MIAKILIVFIACFKVIAGDLTSVIQTDKGPVQGEILTTVLNSTNYSAFKGIPYAKSPVDSLRFKPPVEAEAWTDVLNATVEGTMCTQYNSAISSVVGSEDCLYINVFTPHTEFNENVSKPVMVWIYGGAFLTGNSNASYYGPDFLLEEDVIVVSFNYRLGALGFLNLQHENATGNYGLKDQSFALKWVQNNIARFGGDPDQVTIFGQSAGSVSVDLQVISPMSSGLFKQAISMSGSTLCLYWGFQSSAEAQEQAFLLGSKLGTTTISKDQLLQALRNASAADIVIQTKNIGLIPFRPTLESTTVAVNETKFLTECSVKSYLTGNYTKGPHIMGFTSEETISFAGSVKDLVDMANSALASIQNSTSSDVSIFTTIVEAVTNGVSNLTNEALYKLVNETSDLFFYTGIDTKQRLLQLHNSYPIYYYRFSFNSNYSTHKASGVDLNGVGHSDDLPYIFYMSQAEVPLDVDDIALTRSRMVRLWTNFAKYGNPTPDGEADNVLGTTWTESGSSGKHLEINTTLTMGSRPVDATVKTLQKAGLGASPVLNECVTGIIPDILNSLVSIIGLVG